MIKSNKKITLTIDFHNTETRVIAREIGPNTYRISDRQWYDARRRMCGMPDCKCVVKSTGFIIDPVYGGFDFIEENAFWADKDGE